MTGADDEGEMGAWHFVQAPLRLRNLRVALDEYLRFGLEAGVFIVPQQPKQAAAATRRIRGLEPARAGRTTRARTKTKTATARKKQTARTSRRNK
jgi:hypothetical protein